MAETDPHWICLDCAKDHARRLDCTTRHVPFEPGRCDFCGAETKVAPIDTLGGKRS